MPLDAERAARRPLNLQQRSAMIFNASDEPVHPGALAPGSDRYFASGLNDPTVRSELRVAHALLVFDVVDALARPAAV